MAAAVRLPTGDPLATLKSPVVWIRQYHLHKHVVVRCQTETSYIKTEEREHPPVNTKEKAHEHNALGTIVTLNNACLGFIAQRTLLLK